MRLARLLLGLLLTGATAGAQLRPGLLESLVQDSPFRPGQGGAAADGGSAQFEFRGVVVEAGWVKLDETGRSFVARRYDPDKDTLVMIPASEPEPASWAKPVAWPLESLPLTAVPEPTGGGHGVSTVISTEEAPLPFFRRNLPRRDGLRSRRAAG